MNRAVLSLDTRRSGRSQAGVVWTGVCLRLGDLDFPDAQWTDFAVVVLDAWVRALAALLRGTESRQEIMFMEGPFSVELEAATNRTWQLTCLERGSRQRSRARTLVDSLSLSESAIQTSGELLELCRAKDWWSADAAALESSLLELRNEVANLAH